MYGRRFANLIVFMNSYDNNIKSFNLIQQTKKIEKMLKRLIY